MANLGVGILPSGATGNEISAITRRAFVPKLVVQLYNSSPLLAACIANAQPASGGVNSVTVPVQGAAMTTAAWTDYSGSFAQPTNQNGIKNAEFALKALVVPTPFLGFEGAVQLDHAIIPRIEAVMNDATNNMCDTIANALFLNGSGTAPFTTTNNQAIIGLPGAIDDGTNMTTYGNISRSTDTYWKSKVYAAGNVNPTRANVLQYITGVLKNGAEMPTFGVMGAGTWALLAQDFVAQESYIMSPGQSFDTDSKQPHSGFRALMVSGVPIYLDPYCPEGVLYLANSNYLSLYIHENAAFAFTGFESTLPNFQIGYIGAVVAIMELVSTKPKTMARVSGYNSLTI